MSERVGYQYVVLRCVPRVDREEFVNVGVVLYSQARDYLCAAGHVNREHLVSHLRTSLARSTAVFAADAVSGAGYLRPTCRRRDPIRALPGSAFRRSAVNIKREKNFTCLITCGYSREMYIQVV